MFVIQPTSARHRAEWIGDQLSIRIPSRKHWFHIPFLSVWLVFWFGAWSSTAASLFSGPFGLDGFLLVWLIGWTIGGIYAMTTLFWMLFGRDDVEITYKQFRIRRQVFGLGHTKTFDTLSISDLRVMQYPPPRSFWNSTYQNSSTVWKLDGPITFDYGARTYHFGDGVDEAEAKQIVAHIQQHFPALL